MPQYIINRQIYAGHVYPTDYGWRYFPGAAPVRKDLAAIRAAGYTVKRMACGTYRCEACHA